MIDDPLAFQEFSQRFSSDQACVDALFEARWPNGFRCPKCSHTHCYVIRSRRLPLYECSSCHRQTSIIAGTVMEGSSTTLPRWFQAIYLLSQPSGVSSTELSEILGVTYKTAWLINHKIRHAMTLEIESRILAGSVRIEQFEYGSIYYPDAQHPLLLVATINNELNPEQIRIVQPSPSHVIEDWTRRVSKEGLEACREACTDGKNVTITPRARKSLSSIHPYKNQSRRWLNDTFCGIRAKHLQAYLNEFCYRANQKIANYEINSIITSTLSLCIATPVLPYPVLTQDKPVLQPPWKRFSSKSKWRGRWLSLLSA